LDRVRERSIMGSNYILPGNQYFGPIAPLPQQSLVIKTSKNGISQASKNQDINTHVYYTTTSNNTEEITDAYVQTNVSSTEEGTIIQLTATLTDTNSPDKDTIVISGGFPSSLFDVVSPPSAKSVTVKTGYATYFEADTADLQFPVCQLLTTSNVSNTTSAWTLTIPAPSATTSTITQISVTATLFVPANEYS